jgi:uncharacterized protein YqeY
MSLEQKINEDMKAAMKAGEKDKLTAIRSIRAAILEFKKSGTGEELNEEAEINLLKSAAKKRKDSIEMYEKAGRDDLKEKEQLELEVIEKYLPEMMSDDEIRNKLNDIIEKVGAEGMKDMGKVMGMSMKEFQGKADGGTVNKIAKEILEAK